MILIADVGGSKGDWCLVDKNKVVKLKRHRVHLTQTPQCFDYKTLYNLSKNNRNSVTDESALFLNNNKKVKFIKGEDVNIKITKKK